MSLREHASRMALVFSSLSGDFSASLPADTLSGVNWPSSAASEWFMSSLIGLVAFGRDTGQDLTLEAGIDFRWTAT